MDLTLTVFAIGGLCNRLKPIFSGLDIARRTGRRLRVCWPNNFFWHPESMERPIALEWPGDFADLFSTQIEDCSREEVDRLWAESPEWNQKGSDPFENSLVDPADDRPDILRATWKFLRLPGDEDCDGRTDIVDGRLVEAFRLCRPVPAIQARVDSFAAEHGIDGDAVAVHIRSLHHYCRQFTAADYLRGLEGRVRGRLFVASDSEEIEREILRAYPEAVALPKTTYGIVEGLANGDAVADLFLLARAGTIVGTAASTFAHVAWYLGGCRAAFVDVLRV